MAKKYVAKVNNSETQELEVFHVEANSLDEAIRKLQDIYEPSSNGDHWSDYEPSEFTEHNVMVTPQYKWELYSKNGKCLFINHTNEACDYSASEDIKYDMNINVGSTVVATKDGKPFDWKKDYVDPNAEKLKWLK